MLAYVAVFDGHDGPRASEYCYKGLLPHILSETEDCIQKHRGQKPDERLIKAVDGSKVQLPLDAGIINAFHRAQERFGMKLDPPTYQHVKEGVKATRYDNKGPILRLWANQKRKPRGGTTALTLHIVSSNESDCLKKRRFCN